jgi:hypothetical protein
MHFRKKWTVSGGRYLPVSVFCALSIFSACCAFGGQKADVQTKTTDWCEISVPKTIKVGENVELRIKLTGLDGKVFVTCDLKDQNNNMVKWGGPARPLEKGGETVYSLRVRDLPGLESVYVYMSAARTENDNSQKPLGEATTPTITITGRSPFLDLEFNKSWIYVDVSAGGNQLVSGDKWEVSVEYFLDPSEHFGTTWLYVWGTGPWIDTPDGKYTTQRGHIGYAGIARWMELTEPGRGRRRITFTVPKGLELVRKNNPVLLLSGFGDANAENWPWQVRANTSFVRKRGFFEIETDVPGHLFTYDEPVSIAIRLKNVERAGEKKSLLYSVHDTAGSMVAEGRKEFTVERDGQEIAIDLNIKNRGVFLIEIDVPGWEKRHTTFARIPDLKAITKGRPTRFGMTTHGHTPTEEVWAVAQRLGLTTCRRFTHWYRLQPGKDVYKLDELEKELLVAKKYGIDTWLCIVDPPPFAFPGKVASVGFHAFDFREDVWRDFVATVTTRLKGKFYGWEWLNEITPGGCENPVGTYVKMCRIGTEAAKAVDPKLVTILAGGLYPRSFRADVLTAGVGKYVDALPVHYQNGDGVLEARQDLDAAGLNDVAVWENESAKGLNAWGVPPLEEMQNTVQSDWVLRQWTDELAAGCQKIIYFGGRGSADGSHGYLLDDLSPRPVAGTLAVFTSKTFGAKPLGVFLLGNGGLFHLFDRDGKPLLVASTYESEGETVNLHTGTESVLVTDYQGNERSLSAPGGNARLELDRLPCFVGNVSLDTLKAYVVPHIHVARVGAGTSANVAEARRMTPRVSMLEGNEGKLTIRMSNLYDRELSGKIRVDLPRGWPAVEPMSFSLETGKDQVRPLALAIPKGIETGDYPVNIAFSFDWEKLPRVERPVVLSVISPDMLGNLMPNGGFETPDATGKGPDGWRVNGKTKMWASAEGLGDGLGKHVLKFENSPDWEHCSRTIPLRGGQTYLYTAWVRNKNMDCGSNMTQHLTDGRQIRFYDVQIFSCGVDNPHWQVFTCRKEMPPGTKEVSFTPVVKGGGFALWDNIRVTIFEGTDYAAEAHRIKAPPKIDGSLDEWVKKCPIPLIGRNQITDKAAGYAWTPENLSAIGHLMWDDTNLYLAFKVRDNVHHATGSGTMVGQQFIEGDSLILGVDPTHRVPSARSRSFAYYLSSAVPGGGSGAYTLFRPSKYSGGRQAGHLFKDSSIYNMAVTRDKGVCTYELRIPLTEIGAQGSLGTKIGFSIQLNDNDSTGRVAQINWGGGLFPKWLPARFGVVTLVE